MQFIELDLIHLKGKSCEVGKYISLKIYAIFRKVNIHFGMEGLKHNETDIVLNKGTNLGWIDQYRIPADGRTKVSHQKGSHFERNFSSKCSKRRFGVVGNELKVDGRKRSEGREHKRKRYEKEGG